ncbi:MAG: hypothetical protein J7L23_02985 [Candidatus Diapherotrites archaeon]|nr:hypothetical protein [Candidatus Diapherotrites archaeon]
MQIFKAFCVIVLIALLPTVSARSQPIRCIPDQDYVNLTVGPHIISCSVKLPEDWKKEWVYDIEVTFKGVPGLKLNDTRTKIIGYLGKTTPPIELDWFVNVTQNKTYYLKDAFETTWDNKVSLELFKPSNSSMNTSKRAINLILSGRTDDRSFCDKMVEESTSQDEANFWSNYRNCNVWIHLEGPLIDYEGSKKPTINYTSLANDSGYFDINVTTILVSGRNDFTLTVTDPSGNTKSKVFTVYYTPSPLEGTSGLIVIAIGVMLFIIIIAVIAYLYSKKRAAGEVEKTMREKELEKEREHLEELKQRKIELKTGLSKLSTKKINVGLTAEEESRMRAYENELVRLEDELLGNAKYLEELRERAKTAVEQAKSGVSSSEIRKQLSKEGYTESEMDLIKKYFNELKG